VAALAGSLSAALAAMVARLTIGKKKYAEVEQEMNAAAGTADSLRRQLLNAVTEDSAAYTVVMDAYKLDKADPEREATIQRALRGAAEVPLSVMRLALQAMQVARTVADHGNVNATSDAAVAVYMAMAALEGAALNVRVNVKGMTDTDAAAHLNDTADRIINEARSLSSDVIGIVHTRAGLNKT
jgi:glutamate formiminotransferase/formiminotetrahydrofolate cyclodeaminase